MITTDTGAKKIENSDNWRQIFDAHNDSVDAEDKLAPDMAPIVNGNKCAAGAAAGEYVLVRNSSITGITDGAYRAAQAIPANTVIDSTYLTAITGGIANDLNSNIDAKMPRPDSFTIANGAQNLAFYVGNSVQLIVGTSNWARFGILVFCNGSAISKVVSWESTNVTFSINSQNNQLLYVNNSSGYTLNARRWIIM